MNKELQNVGSGSKTLYGFAWIVCIISGTIAALSVTIALAFNQMQNFMEYPEGYSWKNETDGGYSYTYDFGTITNVDAFNKAYSMSWTVFIATAVVAVVFMIIILINTGKLSKYTDGTIRLNWFDRIWTEVHILAMVLCACGVACLFSEGYHIFLQGDFFSFFSLYDEAYVLDIPPKAMLALMILADIAMIGIFVLCAASVVKNIKAHQFWEKSLLGGIFLWIWRTFRNSDSTMLKAFAVILLGVILSATWFGAPVIIILALIFVPKTVKKFYQIRKGVEEVKNGNLTYKIPVEEDAKGAKGELDRLASDINQISQASNIAVQNELKNQRMKTELISNVSHDLKTPLTSMISYVDLLKTEGLGSENAPEYLDIIDQKTQRLKVLTENLFEAAKASSGAIPVNMSSIDISAMLSQSLGEMDEKLKTHDLEILVNNQCEGIRVMADGQLLWRVFENVLGNISKYALDRSRVYINLTNHDNRVVVEFKNISRDQLNISAEELMERFKRGDESRNTEGSGLGLAIAKDLTKLMGGVFEIAIDGDLFKASLMLDCAPQETAEAETGETQQ